MVVRGKRRSHKVAEGDYIMCCIGPGGMFLACGYVKSYL